MIEKGFVGSEDPVGEPIVTQELPDILDGVQLWTFRRERQEGDVGGNREAFRHVPAGLIEKEDGVAPWRDLGRDLLKMQAHGLRVAAWQDEGCSLAFPGTDGAEDVGRGGALIMRREGPCAAPGPSSGDLVLLSDACLVGKPDLYRVRLDAFAERDRLQAGGEAFLKSSIAPCAWA
jgi:hypothetical protein